MEANEVILRACYRLNRRIDADSLGQPLQCQPVLPLVSIDSRHAINGPRVARILLEHLFKPCLSLRQIALQLVYHRHIVIIAYTIRVKLVCPLRILKPFVSLSF